MPRLITDNEIVTDLRNVAQALGHHPSITEYREKGRYAHTLPTKRFGSWQGAIEAAGLVYTFRHPVTPRETDPNAYFKDLRAVANRLGHPPTRAEYEQAGKYYPATLIRRAGSRWEDVLVCALGLEPGAAHAAVNANRGFRTDEDRLQELRMVARKLKHIPTATDARKAGVPVGALRERFGPWPKVLAAAGLKTAKSKARPAMYMSEDGLMSEVRRIAFRVGRVPSPEVFNINSRVNSKTVAARLGNGSWKSAMKRIFGEAYTPHSKIK